MLEIVGLVKTFHNHPALQGIHLKLEKGEVYGLLGPNGAGKTTTLKILAGLMSQDSGDIFVNGERYHRDNSRLKQIISYVPDQPFVYPKLTGEEHLQFFADLYKMPQAKRKEKFDFFFDYFEFQLYRSELVETYSAGTRQKLLISQALMVEPEILLLDEPLTSIDPLVGRKFKQLLKKISAGGTIVLFATHILSLAQDVSHRLGIIIDGKIIKEGTVEELLNISPDRDLEEFYFHTVMNYEKSF
ncbi:MAG TPA: ABC transporter ATP-binding protein [Candidatus Deferrimicrobium sp.]|nr:ABC transporter ATP-binding protein [Candidatus Kapabacteria bacterium]HLP58358.1 ABC transporter ATP-binding protein [Candidatus Deferrimicrobium sp.]